MEFAILILQTELLLVKKSLRVIERMEAEVQHELNTAALKIQEADLQRAITRLQEAECQKPHISCDYASAQKCEILICAMTGVKCGNRVRVCKLELGKCSGQRKSSHVE
jgi:hypothetical protein